MTNLYQRVFISILAAPLLILSLYSKFFCHLVIFTTVVIATRELVQLMYRAGAEPLGSLVLAGTAAYLAALTTATYTSWVMAPFLILFVILILLLAHQLLWGIHPIETCSSTLLPFAYLTIPLSCTIPLISLTDGKWWLLFLIAVTKGGDMAAYFVGRQFGSRPLAPLVSPKKTYEGAAAGVVGAVILGVAIGIMTPISLPLLYVALLALALATAAQFGDLTESLFKRAAGAKNSSSLPGLGGVLDIVDSLVFSTPLLYILLKITLGDNTL